MKAFLIVLGVIVVTGVLGGGCVYQGYRQAITLDEAVHSQWSNVETQLQRRFDLIPNLVETAKGLGQQEQKVMLGIADARKSYGGAQTMNEKAQAAGQFEGALARLLVISENYPQLKSSEAFLKLQDEIAGTENRLNVERNKYNKVAEDLNVFVRPFPGSFYASLGGVQRASYFKVDEEAKANPKVDFSDKPAKAEKE
jgi:LemA protein